MSGGRGSGGAILGLSGIMIFGGLIWLIVVRILAWWNHG